MRIEKIETITLRHSWGPPEKGVTRDWTVTRVHAEDGLTGIGRGGSADLTSREFAPLLVGEDPRRIALLWDRMYRTAWRFRGPGRAAMTTIGAIDIALWDLYGKSCGEPVWRLLGGFRDRVPVYADGIGYNANEAPAEVAALVRKHADQGYRAVKFHLVEPDVDLTMEKVRLSREALGPDLKLMVDVHGVWDGPTCVEMAKRFNPYGLYWIEEPVPRDDEIGIYRLVREASNALVAGGEGEGTLYGAQRLVAEGGLQVLQSDIVVAGGYTNLLRMAGVAEAHRAYIAPHGAQYPDLICPFLAGVPNGLMVPACPASEPYQIWSKMYSPRFEVKDGEAQMTEKPGLGLELDEAFVKQYRVG